MKDEDGHKGKVAYFDRMGPLWDETTGNYGERRLKLNEVFGLIRLRPGDRVLDAGCGNGILFDFIEERVGPEGILHAIDPAPAMIARAREKYSHYDNISYQTEPVERALLPDDFYECILCFASFPHFDDKSEALRLLRRCAGMDARLYIFHLSDTKTLNDFHGGLDSPVRHDRMPGREELEKMLAGAGFRLEEYIDRTGLNFAGAVLL